jgi:hypothetical protein
VNIDRSIDVGSGIALATRKPTAVFSFPGETAEMEKEDE